MISFFQRSFLSLILVPLFILSVAASFARFYLEEDYFVSYNASCDPSVESCFVECIDEACEDKEYYKIIEKYAPDLKAQCGIDISDCDSAEHCQDGETRCSITLCEASTGGPCVSPADLPSL